MSAVYLVVFIALLYAVMHFFTQMSHRQKLQVSAGLLLVVAAAAAWNGYTDRKQAHVRSVILKFNQHKRLECAGVEVDDRNYTLSIGTQSFIAKAGSPHAGQIFDAAGCQ